MRILKDNCILKNTIRSTEFRPLIPWFGQKISHRTYAKIPKPKERSHIKENKIKPNIGGFYKIKAIERNSVN